jgi:hypothetical protein
MRKGGARDERTGGIDEGFVGEASAAWAGRVPKGSFFLGDERSEDVLVDLDA